MSVAEKRNAAAGGLAEPALDLHEGISAPGGVRTHSAVDGTLLWEAIAQAPLPASGCPRWPEHLRLRSSLGEVVPGRCRATNKCAYCARLAAVETSEMLMLDAM